MHFEAFEAFEDIFCVRRVVKQTNKQTNLPQISMNDGISWKIRSTTVSYIVLSIC